MTGYKIASGLRLALLSCAASMPLLAAQLVLSAPARAQSAGGSAADSGGIEEIVVTTQRREERLQQVPLSVSAFTGEQLQAQDITEIDRLEEIAPGLRIGRSGSDARPAMRGTYTENIAANGDPRFGIYLDDVYQSRTSETPPLVDLERVEVQKGPQGTLYGRNSFGGNIAFYSAAPKDHFEADLNALYGSYDRYKIDGYVNAPITDGLAARVGFLREASNGWVHNRGTGGDLGDEDQYYVRGTLRFAPPAMDGKLEVLVHASYWNQGGAGLFGFGYKQLGSLVDIPTIRAPGGSLTRGGQTYNFPTGFNGSSFSGTPTNIDTRYRDGIADINGADIGIPTDTDPYTVNFEKPQVRKTRFQEYSSTINLDLGPVRLRSISSYSDLNLLRTADDGTPAPYFYSIYPTVARTVTQEVQLLSGDDSPIKYIVGGYYFDDHVVEDNITENNRQYSTQIALATGQYPLYLYSFSYFPTSAQYITQYRSDSLSTARSDTTSYAGYGQASYSMLDDRLTITGGYRFTRDEKFYAASQSNASPTGGANGIPAYFVYLPTTQINFNCNQLTPADASSNATNYSQALITRCGRQNFNFSTYRGALDYKITPDNLVYASVSNGRHAGGFNNTLSPTTNTLIPFSTEKVTAYEVGTKNDFFDHTLRVNVAGYYNDYSNLQAQTSVPNPSGTGTFALVQNIGKDEAYGVDLDATYRPIPALTLRTAANYLYAREREYAVNTFSYGFCGIEATGCAGYPAATLGVQGTPFPNPVSDPNRFVPVLDASGRQIVVGGVPQYNYIVAGRAANGVVYSSKKALSPRWTMNVDLSYQVDLGEYGMLIPEVQTYYNSGYILTDISPNFGNQSSYTKTDLRLSYLSPDGKFSAQAFVENLEDQAVLNRVAYSSNRSLSVNYAQPLTWGLRVGYRFGEDSAPEPMPASYTPPAPEPKAAVPAMSYLVFFDFDKSVITPEASRIIANAAGVVKGGQAAQVSVTGHTDLSGSDAYNLALSKRRAQAVADQLIADGVLANEIVLSYKGKREPLVPTADGVREPQNRRAEIVLQ